MTYRIVVAQLGDDGRAPIVLDARVGALGEVVWTRRDAEGSAVLLQLIAEGDAPERPAPAATFVS